MDPRLISALHERSRAHDDRSRPAVLDLAAERDVTRLRRLLDSGAVRWVHDTIEEQLDELLATREPARTWSRADLDEVVRAHLAGRQAVEYGRWVHYPWSARLVHVLPPSEFRELRTDRNRYKITQVEQDRLGQLHIGVVGLSVGNAAALTLALEGIGGSFKLADFDRLGLSNLNRIRAGIAQLGLPKTALTARQMVEINPYLDIELFPAGVGMDNIDEFLTGGQPLDLLIEESDSLDIKVELRERARAHRIPVIMDTSDRGMLDIERFDLDADRPIFHGLLGTVRSEQLRGLDPKDKVPFLLAIAGESHMSDRMAASLPEIEHTISSWPQLASGVALGGALVADTVRRITLGEHRASGRFYLDMEIAVADGAGMFHEPTSPPPPVEIAEEAQSPRRPPAGGPVATVDVDAVRRLTALGTLAPSGHNAQPWSLRWRADTHRLECRHDSARDTPLFDFERGATWIAFGALAENLELAAGTAGLAARIVTWPAPDDHELVSIAEIVSDGSTPPDALAAFITERVTNRRRDGAGVLSRSQSAALIAAASQAGAALQLLTRRDELAEIGALMGSTDRISLLNRGLHQEATSAYRWTPQEVRESPHGIDVATLELTPAERAGLRLLQQWRVAKTLGKIGGGHALEDLSRTWAASASAVGLITVPGVGRQSYFRGGRAMQRVWLTATALGLGFQPMTLLVYLFARLERGGGAGLTEPERAELHQLRDRFRGLLNTHPDAAEVLLFRLTHAGPPSARSLRRPLDETLRIG
ncbi:MAG: Rv1355c family protein [Pseudonocardiaceae bacterium]